MKNAFLIFQLGRYRFTRPRQLRAWDRDYIRDTVTLPNACPQTPDEFFGNFSGSQMWNPNTNIDEDCLHLNVYAPRNKTTDEVPFFLGSFHKLRWQSRERELVKMSTVLLLSKLVDARSRGDGAKILSMLFMNGPLLWILPRKIMGVNFSIK